MLTSRIMVNLDPSTAKLVEKEAKKRDVTKAAVVRRIILFYFADFATNASKIAAKTSAK